MPILTHTVSNLTVPNSPEDPVHNGLVDLSILASQYYSKTVRQGNSFKLKGVSANILPASGVTQDWDTGASVTCKLSYAPVTKITRMAWNHVFKQWLKQKRLKGMVGESMRYDDFELGYEASTSYYNTTRTSTIHASGIGDDNSERVMLYGGSTQGTDYTLQDYINSQHDAPPASVDPFDSTTIKEAKFSTGSRWPASQLLFVSGTSSNVVTDIGTSDAYSGSVVLDDMKEFPIPVNVLCGLLKLNVYVPIDDTLTQWADSFDLMIHFHVESWKPLVYRPKPKTTKRAARRKSSGRRFSRKRNRR